ncbi:MAG: creatininase family protein [Spirochaetes bacterium]|nr:creatininase family protein [Spirochaetota bacterium]
MGTSPKKVNARRKTGRRSPSTNILHAAKCRLDQFDALNREKTLFILPVGSLEVHGYHLTNDTDMRSSLILAEGAGGRFAAAHRDWTVVLLPLLNIGTDELPLPGSIEFSRKTVYRALVEYARSLERWGFRNLMITNGHGGLRHNIAIDDACRTCNRRYRMRMISPCIRLFQDFIFGKKFRLIEAELGRKLRAPEKEGLTDLEHAGGWETSFMLNADRDLVSPNYPLLGSSRIKLGAGTIRLARFLEGIVRRVPGLRGMLSALGMPLEEGFRFIVTAGKMYDQKKERYTYSGNPGVASPEIGRAWGAAMSREIEAVMEGVYVTGDTQPSSVVSNHSALFFFRRDVILAATWTALALLVIAVLAGVWHAFFRS